MIFSSRKLRADLCSPISAVSPAASASPGESWGSTDPGYRARLVQLLEGGGLGEVIPLRDIFAMLFFVSVGMLLDPAFSLEGVRGDTRRKMVAVACEIDNHDIGIGERLFDQALDLRSFHRHFDCSIAICLVRLLPCSIVQRRMFRI